MVRRAVALDYPLVLLALGLSVGGVAAVYSAGQTDVSTSLANLWRMQSLYLALGLGAAWLASRVSVRVLDYLTPAVYAASVALLVLLLLDRKSTRLNSSHLKLSRMPSSA